MMSKSVNDSKQSVENLRIFHSKAVVKIAISLAFTLTFLSLIFLGGAVVFAAVNSQQPNIKASDVYQIRGMTLGNNVKNLVILIPNEAHESMNQPKNQLPLINQPYVPQNAVINVGTDCHVVSCGCRP